MPGRVATQYVSVIILMNSKLEKYETDNNFGHFSKKLLIQNDIFRRDIVHFNNYLKPEELWFFFHSLWANVFPKMSSKVGCRGKTIRLFDR